MHSRVSCLRLARAPEERASCFDVCDVVRLRGPWQSKGRIVLLPADIMVAGAERLATWHGLQSLLQGCSDELGEYPIPFLVPVGVVRKEML